MIKILFSNLFVEIVHSTFTEEFIIVYINTTLSILSNIFFQKHKFIIRGFSALITFVGLLMQFMQQENPDLSFPVMFLHIHTLFAWFVLACVAYFRC